MKEDQKWVGERSKVYEAALTPAVLQGFAHSVAWSASEYGSSLPPTWITTCRDGEFELFKRFGVPLSRVLHTDQAFEFLHPERAPEGTVSYSTVLEKALEKTNDKGTLRFLTFKTDLSLGEVSPWAVSRTTVVIREFK